MINQDYKKRKVWLYRLMLFAFVGLLLVFLVAAITIGRYDISFGQVLSILLAKPFGIEPTWDTTMESVVFNLRLPRTIAAMLIGAALAVSGAAYQGMFKNPMVSPDLLGVASGAAIGASLGIILGLSATLIQGWAFIGGIIAVSITATIPRFVKNDSVMVLVLAGVIVEGLMSSIMGIIRYFADPDTALAEIVYWTMGSVASTTWEDILLLGPGIAIALALMIIIRFRLNVLSLGEAEAKSLGINVKATRRIIIILSTFLTASAVCMAGTVGWVGLVIPHLGRMLAGSDNRKMLPIAMLMGSCFMIAIDTIARALTTAELPISIITGIIGAPFYFYLLAKGRTAIR